MQPFSWGVPGVEVTPPTAKSIEQPVPTNFAELEFSPQGVYDLRRMLGALPTYPGAYTRNQTCFDAADVAWFIAGCSTDGKHSVPEDEFHPVLERMYTKKFGKEARRLLKDKLQRLVFDSATMWDRAFGGSTMVIHIDPNMSPGTPTAPEYLKALVYLPPSTVVSELPDAHVPLADIVQSFIVHVGLHTKLRWERIGKNHLGWNFGNSNKPRPAPDPLPAHLRPIPAPSPSGSSVYTFHGRDFTPLAPSAPSAPLARSHKSNAATSTSATLVDVHGTSPDDMYDNDSDDDSMYQGDDISSSYIAAFNTIDWENQRRAYEEREQSYKQQIRSLQEQVSQLQLELDQKSPCGTADSSPLLLRSPFAETALSYAAPAPVFFSSDAPLCAPATSPFAPAPSLLAPPSPFTAPFGKSPVTPHKKRNMKEHGTPSSVKSPNTPRARPAKFMKVPVADSSTPSSKSTSASTPLSQRPPFLSASAFVAPAAPVPIQGVASRAALLAQSLGYDGGRIAALHLIAQYVQPALWFKQLEVAGFRIEDIEEIISAMIIDMS